MVPIKGLAVIVALIAGCATPAPQPVAPPATAQDTVAPQMRRPPSPPAGDGRFWPAPPAVSIIGAANDPRRTLVREAIAFWDRQFAAIGSPFRFGPVTDVVATVPGEDLRRMSESLLAAVGRPGSEPFGVPLEIARHPGDLLVLLAQDAFVSFAGPFFARGRRLVGLRSLDSGPFTRPAVARNLIAHELGHAIGLGHNADPAMLMCGRPASCRPEDFASPDERWFELTDHEKTLLRAAYPSH